MPPTAISPAPPRCILNATSNPPPSYASLMETRKKMNTNTGIGGSTGRLVAVTVFPEGRHSSDDAAGTAVFLAPPRNASDAVMEEVKSGSGSGGST